jgi:phosphonate transport system ATP-binding protein
VSVELLKVDKLKKVYPSGIQALSDVSFEVKAGEFLVIIGLSGSGKSTLLRCLNRLETPTSGEIWFGGDRVDQLEGQSIYDLRKEVAMIFQHFNLIPRHSVLSNVLMGRLGATPTWKSLFGFFSDEDRRMALQELRRVGIENKADVRADHLSGGQQQRVAIARALCQNPKLLLADEPVASLDPATAHTVMDELQKINREMGLTVICSLHFLSLVREYATRVLALKEGRIVFEGAPNEIDQKWFQRIYGVEARDVDVR